ncbi:hypothetical protein BCV64_02575 [Cylindrospermopsis raciborskii MVCC14]|nr:hypothetical protein BCV64_02575 [Cylindrospermopsis raciborskii MVCC14]
MRFEYNGVRAFVKKLHRFPLSGYHVQRSIVNPPRKKFGAAVIGDKVNSDRLVGILWSHPVFNLQKSSGTVMGHRVNGDRFLVKGENISNVRNTIASIHL